MRPYLLPFATLTSAQTAGTDPAVGGSGCVTWHTATETTGSATAAYQLWDGEPTQGRLLLDVTLAAGESTRDYIGLHALPFISALYLKVTSGTVAGSVQVWGDHSCEAWYRAESLAREVTAAAAAETLTNPAG